VARTSTQVTVRASRLGTSLASELLALEAAIVLAGMVARVAWLVQSQADGGCCRIGFPQAGGNYPSCACEVTAV